MLPEIGVSGQEKLIRSKVLIVGAGGLGCSTAQYLAAAGVGTIGLMDYDKVDISNLNRQILYTEKDVGKAKVHIAKKALHKLNNQVEIIPFNEQLIYENANSIFKAFDLIIDGTDNFQTKYIINDASVGANKPWIYASIYKYQGQLSVFNYQGGPTYRCLYPNVNTRNISCEETGVLGVVPALLGTMQAVESIKVILGIGQVLTGKLKVIDLLTMREQLISFSRNEEQVRIAQKQPKNQETYDPDYTACNKVYLDVRDPVEVTAFNKENVLHIPMAELKERHVEIPREVPIHVICHSGARSRDAIKLLSEKYGFQNLINVNGGIQSLLK